ncbi:MAG: CocE/NonD family hydrolase [Armatimonadetes bacterium]|nr:CocE/NonD family hydrolase [Armatimonadota bacterium]
MRDGVRLSPTVFLPDAEGPFPAVLARAAYNRLGFTGQEFAARGFALIARDCRGRYDSEGEGHPFIHEEADGFDTLEWAGRQPWCSGKVGMFGDSYLAATQFYAALKRQLLPMRPEPPLYGRRLLEAGLLFGAFSLALP